MTETDDVATSITMAELTELWDSIPAYRPFVFAPYDPESHADIVKRNGRLLATDKDGNKYILGSVDE